MNRCDPLLAGLPRHPNYSVSGQSSSPSRSNVCLPANRKGEKFWGSSSDKTLDCTTQWSRISELENLGPAASEDTVRSVDGRPGRGLGPQPHGAPPTSNPDLQKDSCNDQNFVKRHYDIAKKPLETSSSKVKVKSTMMIPDSQKLLRCELESLKSQLQAQTKAFEFLNHSVTMLEKESCLQQIKIQQLEEVLSPLGRQGEKEGHKRGVEQGREELYGALAQGLQGLQKTLRDSEEVQRARTTRCLQLLAQEIQDSKKFLWEELELVREEVTFIYQKLRECPTHSLRGVLLQPLCPISTIMLVKLSKNASKEVMRSRLVPTGLETGQGGFPSHLPDPDSNRASGHAGIGCLSHHTTQLPPPGIIIRVALSSSPSPSFPAQVLTKMKQQGFEMSSWPLTEEVPEGADDCWKDDLQKELSDIWSAVHELQNSIDGLAMSSGSRPRASSLRGHKGHRCLSPPLPSWDSDSDSDRHWYHPTFSKSRSFPA
ncbi:coiled-coil domain-containing protein 159 [Tupaia chinensis]|uniref:coiled-coil domain-containing protein 159 n=1 Tax=Tupaia chinensis TaxID=246437 RepID=UPI00070410ED|nr:coiled-coil domain-containing protein 159 [Tupaia chinensis]